jgi:MFS transporter, YNFM family, putative membrane transport protein
MAGFLVGAAGMFAAMYSTQAILPELGRDFDVGPAGAGLTISVAVGALAAGAWVWGPLSDLIGRKRSMVLASALLTLPTVGAGLAPSFEALLACRALQGLCMPGLLAVGLPYVTEAFAPRIGGRAMGYYVASLIAGAVTGRVGVALVAAAIGWRWGVGGLALLTAGAALLMHRALVDVPLPARTPGRARGVSRQLRNRALLRACAVGSGFYFVFVGTFSYATFRLSEPPFGYGTAATSLVFLLWTLGAVTPSVGRIADRFGWASVAVTALALAAAGLGLSLLDSTAVLFLGLGLVALGNFAGVTAAQLGVAAATDVDRGAASAIYFGVYYSTGAFGAYLPGLAWQAWGWNGVAAVGLAVLAATAALSSRGTASARPGADLRTRTARSGTGRAGSSARRG